MLCISCAQANKIELAYLQIEKIDINDKKHNVNNYLDKNQDINSHTNMYYQAIWKQPANSTNNTLSLQFSDDVIINEKPSTIYLDGANIKQFTLIAKHGLAGKTLTIANLEKTNIEVMVKYTSKHNDYSIRLTPLIPDYTFKNVPSSWQTIQSYSEFGIEHILEGYDHLLFVLCLLLIASTLKKLLWAITGFTIAHSITLMLSTLQIVQLPIAVVEAIIALSIVFLATEIAKNSTSTTKVTSLTYRYPVVVSSSFGLLHGFGFASVLLTLGLPKNDQFLALAFFNIGVEIGQVLFIFGVCILLGVVKKLVTFQHSQLIKYQTINAYIIGSIASMWLIQRVVQF